jgi:hypothetical protein
MTEPARGYVWESFQPGNQVALRHGAYCARLIDPMADELIAQIRPTVTWWQPCDEPTIRSWGRAEASIERVSSWLAERGGEIDDDGEVRAAANLLIRLESRAESLRSKLGLDPLSRARLGKDVSSARLDLARLWATEDQDATDAVRGPEIDVQTPETDA